jgi:hypothetical protein
MAWLPARWHPRGAGSECLQQIGVVVSGLSLTKTEDVSVIKTSGREPTPKLTIGECAWCRKSIIERPTLKISPARIRRMFIPSMPISCRRSHLRRGSARLACSRGDLDCGHSARVEERLGDEDCETEEQSARDRHLGDVGIARAYLPAAMCDNDDGDNKKKLCDDPESFRHGGIERSGLSEEHVHESFFELRARLLHGFGKHLFRVGSKITLENENSFD